MLNSGAVRFSSTQGQTPVDSRLAGMIDHTLLRPDATHEQIKKLCEEAAQYKFATVCVNSSNVGLAAKLLAGTGVKKRLPSLDFPWAPELRALKLLKP